MMIAYSYVNLHSKQYYPPKNIQLHSFNMKKWGELQLCCIQLTALLLPRTQENNSNWRVQVEVGGDTQHSWSATQSSDKSWAWKQSFLFRLNNVHENLNIKVNNLNHKLFVTIDEKKYCN